MYIYFSKWKKLFQNEFVIAYDILMIISCFEELQIFK